MSSGILFFSLFVVYLFQRFARQFFKVILAKFNTTDTILRLIYEKGNEEYEESSVKNNTGDNLLLVAFVCCPTEATNHVFRVADKRTADSRESVPKREI